MASKLVDMRAMVFGSLTVVRLADPVGKKRHTAWLCRCVCGLEVVHRRDKLLSEPRKPKCPHGRRGPLPGAPPRTKEERDTHGCWENMIRRCEDPGYAAYLRYGGRGIVVCERWQTFENFVIDLGLRPPGLTIERIDGDGNYEPGNVKWATYTEQNRNRKNTVFVDYQGRRVALVALCEELGLSAKIVHARWRLGWNLESALITPISRRPRR